MEKVKTIGLTKKYGDTAAVRDLDLQIEAGEIFSLLGINGAGKTTTIKMLTCLTKPSAGDAFVGGYSITREQAQIKRKIGVSPQETAVAPNLSVRENLALMCDVHGLSARERESKINELTDKFGLDAILSKKAGRLSGGFQRRLSIAMALVSGPEILFLDEPTLGLDVIARSELWDAIRGMRGKTTVILTTHYMEEAEALSDRIGIMKDGRLLAIGTPHELMAKTNTDKIENAFISIVKEGEI